jgi:hypothetical protein
MVIILLPVADAKSSNRELLDDSGRFLTLDLSHPLNQTTIVELTNRNFHG